MFNRKSLCHRLWDWRQKDKQEAFHFVNLSFLASSHLLWPGNYIPSAISSLIAPEGERKLVEELGVRKHRCVLSKSHLSRGMMDKCHTSP